MSAQTHENGELMKRYAIGLVAIAVLAAGCGTGGNESATTEGNDSRGNPVTSPAGPAHPANDPSKVDPEDFCSNFRLYVLSGMAVGVAAFGDLQDDPEIEKAIDSMRESIDNLAEHAPGDIRDEFVMARDYTEQWVAGLDKGETKPPAESPEYKAASDRIVKYGQDECGDLLPGLPSPEAS